MRLRGLVVSLVLALSIFGVTSLSGARDTTAQVPPAVIGSVGGTLYPIAFTGSTSSVCFDLQDNFTIVGGGSYFGYPGFAGTLTGPGNYRGFWVGNFAFISNLASGVTYLGIGSSSASPCSD